MVRWSWFPRTQREELGENNSWFFFTCHEQTVKIFNKGFQSLMEYTSSFNINCKLAPKLHLKVTNKSKYSVNVAGQLFVQYIHLQMNLQQKPIPPHKTVQIWCPMINLYRLDMVLEIAELVGDIQLFFCIVQYIHCKIRLISLILIH